MVNKADKANNAQVMERLLQAKAAVEALAGPDGLDDVEYFPVSARTGKGVDGLTAFLIDRLPEGPPFFPPDVITDTPEALWVAELVREQLLAKTRDELPHAITCRVTEWEWPHIRVEIIVERDSQKAIVIGKGGEVLKAVGIAVREELPEGDVPRPPRQGGAALAEPRRRCSTASDTESQGLRRAVSSSTSATRPVSASSGRLLFLQRVPEERLDLGDVDRAPHGRQRGQQHAAVRRRR